ncbi:MAG: NAD(P)H-hydrate dehydratase [Kiritimatiellia bacterium]|jgi:NAD(P)H-hydrate epimerase|nr:NAD(P)H-hydrate dehydratase [Kiritimatiellia bacterium]MDP6630288.1 NAD(P)H-hydrate dehydratase [Kiritimatiellia bacterium]MDP6810795.1 NAD(P)H-hydrate dehydratase [Kiritimatiellia bacterium]MDP7024137.1 NAD(P)H-hydrate dehydratase [Kiritimatiellia bacterium]
MKLVTSAQMRELDRRTIEEFGTPGEVLMERAGQGVAAAVLRLAELTGRMGCVRVVAGKGNNGGDAFVVARCLHEMGLPVQLILAAERDALQGDALIHFERMLDAGVQPVAPVHAGGLPPDTVHADLELVVEGILGTGISGAPRGATGEAIALVNQLGMHRPVIAIDVPSGLNSDTGDAAGAVVQADVTATIGLPKRGLVAPQAADAVGNIEVIDIGIPSDYIVELPDDTGLITPADLRHLFPRRQRASHKGTYGHVLLIGGSREFSGAIAMAAMSAVRSGVGLVTVLTPAAIASTVAALVPEAMVHGAADRVDGTLAAEAMTNWSHDLDAFDAVLIGPGLTRSLDAQTLCRAVMESATVPLVLDADALPDAENAGLLAAVSSPLVLTPHPGEMARLLGSDTATVQAERLQTARSAAAQAGATVVLKGHGTVVAQSSGLAAINPTGNPGMASGGMGDVLAGLLAGLLAQGMVPNDAARAAVFLHGRAADMAAWQEAQPSITATDVIAMLGSAFRELSVL